MPVAGMIEETKKPAAASIAFEALLMMVCGAGLAAMLLGACLLALTGNDPGKRDFVSYWTAGHQLLHHADPYGSAAILKEERSVGFPADSQSLIMRNAPWALCLVMPLGLLGLRMGALVWTLLLGGCLFAALHLLWVMHGRPENKRHLLGYGFGPAIVCVLGGQTAVIALLGLVLFLRFHRERPWVAGAALWLCAMKPHLFLSFGVAVAAWVAGRRAYRILAGLGVTLLVSSLLATWLDPAVWGQYAQMMRCAGLEGEFLPCIGVALRFAIRRESMWIEYVPAVLGCVWAAAYYARRRRQWGMDGAWRAADAGFRHGGAVRVVYGSGGAPTRCSGWRLPLHVARSAPGAGPGQRRDRTGHDVRAALALRLLPLDRAVLAGMVPRCKT